MKKIMFIPLVGLMACSTGADEAVEENDARFEAWAAQQDLPEAQERAALHLLRTATRGQAIIDDIEDEDRRLAAQRAWQGQLQKALEARGDEERELYVDAELLTGGER